MRSRPSTTVRIVGIFVLALTLLPLGGGVAAAHGGALEPVSSAPRVLGIDPPVAGLIVTVVESGARLRIDNGTGAEVVVLPPAGAVRTVEPIVAPGGIGRWADLRIDAVALGGTPAEGVRGWSIPLTVGGETVTVVGEQVWPPPPAPGPWWLATALAAVGVTVLGALAVRRRWRQLGSRLSSWRRTWCTSSVPRSSRTGSRPTCWWFSVRRASGWGRGCSARPAWR